MAEDPNENEALNNTAVATFAVYDVDNESDEFDFTLEASVHDAMWALCMQWKLKEFQGEDTGSTIYTRIHTEDTRLTRFKPGNSTSPNSSEGYNEEMPLEARVERESIDFDLGLDLKFGNYWKSLLSQQGISQYHSLFIDSFPIEEQLGLNNNQLSNEKAMKLRLLSKGRVVKGGGLLEFILGSDQTALALALQVNSTNQTISSGHYTKLGNAVSAYLDFYANLFTQPDGDSSWIKNRLEYSFQTSLSEDTNGSQLILDSSEYHGGRLDWYNFDVKAGAPNLNVIVDENVQETRKISFIPTAVAFKGMSHDRWWEMQDGDSNLSFIKPGKTGLIGMIVKDFILNYSNDWSILPYNTPIGTITEVKSIVAKDVFGDHSYIGGGLAEPLGPEIEIDERWSMFKLNQADDSYDWNNRLFIPPTLPRIMEGPSLDKVQFIRDQIANMVWGIEAQVPNELGGSLSGKSAEGQLRQFLRELYTDLAPVPEGQSPTDTSSLLRQPSFRYLAMTYMPEFWIPFIVQQNPNSTVGNVLRRATLPRTMPEKDIDYTNGNNYIQPRTKILREGLDESTPVGYHILDEEVPRAGITVSRSFQRCRWHNGRTYLWMGRRKATGRGEGASGLTFDSLETEQKVGE
jgi:hypothetical protein